MEHMYWMVPCKNPDCDRFLIASYIGYLDPKQVFGIAPGVSDRWEVQCPHCGKLYMYQADSLVPLRQPGPPDEKWVPWF
jgi:hypothetical protein